LIIAGTISKETQIYEASIKCRLLISKVTMLLLYVSVIAKLWLII